MATVVDRDHLMDIDCGENSQPSEMIYKYPQSLVTNYFAAMTVTVDKVATTPIFELPQTLNKHGESAPKKDTRFQRQQAPLNYPTFFSPLMHGHVSGLAESKCAPLAKMRRHQFFHDTLIAERDIFMGALQQKKEERQLKEKKSASLIQHLWRIFVKAREAKARVSLLRTEAGKNIRIQLWSQLAKDHRCNGWAFDAIQRHNLNRQAERKVVNLSRRDISNLETYNRNKQIHLIQLQIKERHHRQLEKLSLDPKNLVFNDDENEEEDDDEDEVDETLSTASLSLSSFGGDSSSINSSHQKKNQKYPTHKQNHNLYHETTSSEVRNGLKLNTRSPNRKLRPLQTSSPSKQSSLMKKPKGKFMDTSNIVSHHTVSINKASSIGLSHTNIAASSSNNLLFLNNNTNNNHTTDHVIAGIDQWADEQFANISKQEYIKNQRLELTKEMIEARRLDEISTVTKPKFDISEWKQNKNKQTNPYQHMNVY